MWEAVDLWASLYRTTVDGNRLLEQLGLADKRNAWFMTLSGGQKQRLFIALALINDPEVVFLDELTTGLDPQARRAIWELVRGIRDRGKTVFLTTHLMEEAERLCDRVAIIEHGRIVDVDRPARLVDRHCPERTRRARHGGRPRRTSGLRAIPRVNDVTRDDDRIHGSRPRRRSRGRGHHVPVRAPDPGDRLPDRHAEPRGRLPEADRPLDSRLNDAPHARTAQTDLARNQDLPARTAGGLRDDRDAGDRIRRARANRRRQPGARCLRRRGAGRSWRVSFPVFSTVLIAISAVLSLVTIISIYREGGILKRLRATPLRPLTILTAHVLVKLLLTATTLVLMVLVGKRYYPVGVDVPLAGFTLALLISTLSILSLGFLISSIVPTARFAQPLGAIILYPMIAVSGLFVPIASLPPLLRGLARFLPLTYAVSLLQGIWTHEPWSAHLGDIAALALAFIVLTAISTRVFRWE